MPIQPHSRLAQTIDDDLRKIRNSDSMVLQYDPIDEGLKPWFWPVNMAGEHIMPKDFLKHRRAWKEMAIYVAHRGQFAGEWVASCTSSQCDYLVPIERIYLRREVPTKHYTSRYDSEPIPA
ncbi:hypothetical protein EW146_g8187 [Bondarzewia mesenterica]|uniref:Uncharacterized protein n=1 Tax=Bondarzewia mesenterica TaxID=1095465 RepID=A0A4S4LGX0_9AGAM|nr:hypothetical protein EW146_g8187 [Bondarzewia mesenterica]